MNSVLTASQDFLYSHGLIGAFGVLGAVVGIGTTLRLYVVDGDRGRAFQKCISFAAVGVILVALQILGPLDALLGTAKKQETHEAP
jgi:hypothetical protein